jgi:hypothetical protein
MAVVFLCFMPLVAGLTRQFLVELPLMAAVLLWHEVLIRSEFLQRQGEEKKLGVILGLGMLLKVTFPLFILGSILAGIVVRVLPPSAGKKALWDRRQAVSRVAVVLCLAAVIAGLWYGPNLIQMLQFAWSTSFGQVALSYDQPLSDYVAQICSFGVSILEIGLIVFAAFVVLIKKNDEVPAVENDNGYITSAAILAILLWLVLPLPVFLMSHDRIVRLMLPCLVAVPVIGGLIGGELRNKSPRLSTAWAAVSVLLGAALFISFSFNVGPVDRVAAGSWVLWGRQLDWDQTSPNTVAWPHRNIVRTAASLVGERADKTVFLLMNQVHLNWLNLKLAALQERLPLEFDFAGGYSNVDSAVARAKTSSLVLVEEGGERGPQWTEEKGSAVTDLLRSGRLGSFKRVYQVSLPDHGSLGFYRSTDASSERSLEGMSPQFVRFGDVVALVGFDLLRSPESLRWRAEWQVLGDLEEDYAVYLHFMDGDRQFGRDHRLMIGDKGTKGVRRGAKFSEEYVIPLTSDIRDLHSLRAGVYKLATLEKVPVMESTLPVLEGKNGLLLNPLEPLNASVR